ncbi:hypothetical protein D3C87_1821300 [compost metagenome]
MAQIKPDQPEGCRQKERNAPAPVEELGFTHRGAEQHDEPRAKHEAGDGAEVEPASKVTALPVRRVFRHENGRTGIFAANGKPLGKLA